jgi:WD40 repeat protein
VAKVGLTLLLLLVMLAYHFGGFGGEDAYWDDTPGQNHEKPKLQVIARFGCSQNAKEVLFAPKGERIITISRGDPSPFIWDWKEGRRVLDFPVQEATAVAFSPDGHRALSVGLNGLLKLWNLGTRRIIAELHQNNQKDRLAGFVQSVVFSPHGLRAYAIGSRDSEGLQPDADVRVWDLRKLTEVRSFEAHETGARGLAVSPDGDKILTCGDTSSILWDERSGRMIHRLRGHTGPVQGVQFLAGSRRAITWGDDSTIQLWDVESGRRVRRFLGPPGARIRAAVSPDGRLLVSCHAQEKVERLVLWDVKTGRVLKTLRYDGVGTGCIAFSPDGLQVLWVHADGAATVYRRGETGKVETPGKVEVRGAHENPSRQNSDHAKKPDPMNRLVSQEAERAILDGVRFLKQEQQPDGSWEDANKQALTGTTSLVTLALLTAGERPDSPAVRKALDFLRHWGPEQLRSTYAIALQTMVFAAAEPERDTLRIAANVTWLESAQIKVGRRVFPGCWTYSEVPAGGDNSNTHYALLGLNAAAEVGVPAKPEVWALAQAYWENAQREDGGWGYRAIDQLSTASMTCAAISSLLITDSRRFDGLDRSQRPVHKCGEEPSTRILDRGIAWLVANFSVGQNFPMGQQWKYYYYDGLEQVGRHAGIRFFGHHDWYRLGAEELVRTQDRLSGFWKGVGENQIVATSFALLFLAKGRAPVLVNKLRHGPTGDWNNDPDDVRNLVNIVSRDWKNLLSSQVLDPDADFARLRQAPIAFLSGHHAPEFSGQAKQNLRAFVNGGGCLLADACCNSKEFDTGFRLLMKELFPEDESKLRPLGDDHPVRRNKRVLGQIPVALWGIDKGGRTAVIYSPGDLSCFWNQAKISPEQAEFHEAIVLGQNAIEYFTGGKAGLDKLSAE